MKDNLILEAFSTGEADSTYIMVSQSAYSREHPDFRAAEVLANMVELAGSGPMGEALLRKVVPTTLEDLSSYLGTPGGT